MFTCSLPEINAAGAERSFFIDSAMHIAGEGLKWHPTSVSLRKVHQRASEVLKDRAGLQINNLDSDLTLSSSISKEIGSMKTRDGFLDLQEQAHIRQSVLVVICSHPKELKDLERCAGPVPDDFCATYIDSQILPVGCDPKESFKVLCEGTVVSFSWWSGILQTKPVNSIFSMVLKSPVGPQDWQDPMQMRIDPYSARSVSAERVAHFSDVEQGGVKFVKRDFSCSYDCHKSFSDVPQHALPIPALGMHVAVNFVDLGELAETLIAQQQKASDLQPGEVGHSSVDMLRWVGVEKSSFCCAKTLVIIQMLRRGADAGHVVQVPSPCQCSF